MSFLSVRICCGLLAPQHPHLRTVKYVPPWAPGAHFQRQAAEWKKSILNGIEKPLKAVTEALVSDVGTASTGTNFVRR